MRLAAKQSAVDATDLRKFERWSLKGYAVPVEFGGHKCRIHLKDLSRSGAAGLMDEPISIDDNLILILGRLRVPARVRWVRRTMVGIGFIEPLEDSVVTRLRNRAGQ